MFKGFKEFISRGNAIDMAVGLIIGAAFTPIVTALNENVIMPFIAAIFGKPDFDNIWTITMGDATILPGTVITALVNFLLIAFALYFFIVAPMNKFRGPQEEETDANTELLGEIRDLLKK